jgi:GT2 family glycosyltransferase
VDDDMEMAPDFLESHLSAVDSGLTVVQGLIAPAPELARMPIFERFHADQLARFVQAVERGNATVRGIDLCTGNLAMLRKAYDGVGGFDKTLGRSEDRELGVRLERAGEKLGLSTRARTTHRSDHASLEVWRKRAFNYGVYDHRIARKHENVETADPWRFWFLVNPVSRPLLLAAAGLPRAGRLLAGASIHAAMALDRVGVTRLAIAGTTLCYGLEYFRGVREDCGSLEAVARDFARYLGKRRHAGRSS